MTVNQPQHITPQEPITQTKTGTSGLAIASLILGILAVLGSFVPVLNIGSILLAVIGLILGIVGVATLKKSGKGGKVMAIVGIVLAALAIIIGIAINAAAAKVVNDVADELDTSGEAVPSESTDKGQGETTGPQELAAGETLKLDNGMEITVSEINAALTDSIGDTYVSATVTYVNNGNKKLDYNSFDWKGKDANGAETDTVAPIIDNNDDYITSGSLDAGGTATIKLGFKEGTTLISYYSTILDDEPQGTWKVS